MLSHIPRASRIFIGLLIITLLLTYIAICLSNYQEQLIFNYGTIGKTHEQMHGSTQLPQVDTSDWVKYQSPTYAIAFSHPKNWSIKTIDINKAGFFTIALVTPNPNPNINIYISKDSYLGFDGLKQEPYKLGSSQGSMVGNNLIGIKTGEYYYTFDATTTPRLLPEFQALMKTVTFQ